MISRAWADVPGEAAGTARGAVVAAAAAAAAAAGAVGDDTGAVVDKAAAAAAADDATATAAVDRALAALATVSAVAKTLPGPLATVLPNLAVAAVAAGLDGAVPGGSRRQMVAHTAAALAAPAARFSRKFGNHLVWRSRPAPSKL